MASLLTAEALGLAILVDLAGSIAAA